MLIEIVFLLLFSPAAEQLCASVSDQTLEHLINQICLARVEVGLYSAQLETDCIPQVCRYFFSYIKGCSWTALNLKLALYTNFVVIYYLYGTNEVTYKLLKLCPLFGHVSIPSLFLELHLEIMY